MLDNFFRPVFTDTFTVGSYLLCTLTALALGGLIAITAGRNAGGRKSFLISLVLLPAIVETIIMLVNGNIGTGLAVAGSFSLVRFRSAPGKAGDIVSIFLAVAVGLAAAVGYLGIAALFTVIICAAMLALNAVRLRNDPARMRMLRITVPESLDYYGAFDDLFEKYAVSSSLVSAKTANMGSLYRLTYDLELRSDADQKKFIDELRCRNGNLEISIGRVPENTEEL
jgi:hypothetical protein